MILTIVAVVVFVALFIYGIKELMATDSIEGFITLLVAVCIAIGSIGPIIDVWINHDVDYQNKLHEREVLEYRIDHISDNLTSSELIYNDIVEFNNELRKTKKWAASPWTNWFYNQDIASLDYVELPND